MSSPVILLSKQSLTIRRLLSRSRDSSSSVTSLLRYGWLMPPRLCGDTSRYNRGHDWLMPPRLRGDTSRYNRGHGWLMPPRLVHASTALWGHQSLQQRTRLAHAATALWGHKLLQQRTPLAHAATAVGTPVVTTEDTAGSCRHGSVAA